MSHLYYFYRLFVIPITAGFVIYSYTQFLGYKYRHALCIVKLPDEVCVRHTKPVGDSKTVLQLKQFAEVLLTGLTFKNLKKKLVTVNFDVVSVCETNYCLILINHSHSFKGLMT